MTTAEDVFWLYERTRYVYNQCTVIEECPTKWNNECQCYLNETVCPVLVGDITLPCRKNIRSYIKIGEECPICLDPIIHKTNAYINGCGHAFHKTCVMKTMESKWQRKLYSVIKCPMCRTSMGVPDVLYTRYNRDNNHYNSLDELENFWLTKDYIMCEPCSEDHSLGMNPSCQKCMAFIHHGFV